MEGKKISFGFMKTKKAEKPVVEEKKEFIECLEEQSIKVVGGEEKEEKAPLVIALKPNTLITAERLKQIAEEVEKPILEPEIKIENPEPSEEKTENETLDQMAVRELLQDSKKPVKVESKLYSVPIPSQPVLDGQKESTLDDYESVPIQEFGLAMLRGMGWAPGKEQHKLKEPQLRPKGLGLGADKVIKKKETKTEKDGKELTLVVNAFVKVINGKHSGYYGKVVSLDDDNGRVVVELAVKKETVSLSEFMVQPVTKAEFDRESRVINADKFEEYKTKEKSQKHSESPKPSAAHSSKDHSRNDNRRDDKDRERNDRRDKERREDSSNGREKDRIDRREKRRDDSNERERDRDRHSEEKINRKDRKKYSSDSLSSDSERKRDSSSDSSPRRHKKSKKHKSEHKRDIDKKRKGKKKRRDRDRSPSYRKHRK